jgi:AbrB family looped-hinge helix DNA binding protein
MEENMPIVAISAKGQVTIPKEVRKALSLQSSDRVIIVLDGEQAIIKPIRGTLLDIGGSIAIPDGEKPIDFQRVRESVKKKFAQRLSKKRASG